MSVLLLSGSSAWRAMVEGWWGVWIGGGFWEWERERSVMPLGEAGGGIAWNWVRMAMAMLGREGLPAVFLLEVQTEISEDSPGFRSRF